MESFPILASESRIRKRSKDAFVGETFVQKKKAKRRVLVDSAVLVEVAGDRWDTREDFA